MMLISMCLFIYTLGGISVALFLVKEEKSEFATHFWPKILFTIFLWPIAIAIYFYLFMKSLKE